MPTMSAARPRATRLHGAHLDGRHRLRPRHDVERPFGGAPPVGDDVSGPETDNAMTRSEEELAVGTRQREAGRARLQEVHRHGRGPGDRPGPARGAARRARADHGRQRRQRDLGQGAVRGGARGRPPRGGGRRREARRAQGARAPRQGRRGRGADGLRERRARGDRDRGRRGRAATGSRSARRVPGHPTTKGRPPRRPFVVPAGRAAGYTRSAMRAIFVTWILLIVTGLAYFTVIGLTHH